MKFKNPATGQRLELAGHDQGRTARRLLAEGWEQVAGPPPAPLGDDFTRLPGVTPEIDNALRAAGFTTFLALVEDGPGALEEVRGIGPALSRRISEAARVLVHDGGTDEHADGAGGPHDGHLQGPGVQLDT